MPWFPVPCCCLGCSALLCLVWLAPWFCRLGFGKLCASLLCLLPVFVSSIGAAEFFLTELCLQFELAAYGLADESVFDRCG